MRFPVPRLERWRTALKRQGRDPRPAALAARLRAGELASPLAVALLAAIALHLLALSALQLRQRRPAAAMVPPPRDDTPELLQFSRQQTREPALTPLSIAALAQLPPPPPPPALAPARGRGGAGVSLPTRATPRAGDLSRTLAGRSRKPAPPSAAGTGSPSRTAQRSTTRGASRDPGLEAALAALSRWPSDPDGGSAAASDTAWPAPQKPEAEQLSLWKRLWEKAIPAGSSSGTPRRLPAGVELRRLPATDSDAVPLPDSHRLSLMLGDKLLLIWSGSAGREVWLLQAPAQGHQTEGTPPGA